MSPDNQLELFEEDEKIKVFERLNQSFTPHKPIDLPEFFAGRVDLLFRAQDAANTSGLHIILFGDRGTGKTSMSRVLAHMLQEPDREEGRRAIFISCNSEDTYNSIWGRVFQEVTVAEKRAGFGFTQGDSFEQLSQLNVTEVAKDPNYIRNIVRILPNPVVIVIDEFDRVKEGSDARRLMADTIKLFSDTNVDSTIMIVGVAESIGELISEHQSISRNITQLLIPPMTEDELSEIIRKGFKRAGLAYEDELDKKMARLSQGYPHYTHLLGLWAGRHAARDHRSVVSQEDLDAAVLDALDNATGSIRSDYERAVASARKNTLFKDVLLACSLAGKDSLGRFSAIDVREPLRKITKRNYDTGAYQSHLAKFCEPERGSILKKSGSRRNYRWQFANPQLIPFVHLQGIRDGRITE